MLTGAARWLELAVRTNGAAGFATLLPRQPLTPAPYATTAGEVVMGGLAAGSYGNALSFSNAANQFAGAFSGSGSGLTNVAGALPWQVVSGLAAQGAPNTAYDKVAQICNLPYRRIAFCEVCACSQALQASGGLPIANLRYFVTGPAIAEPHPPKEG